MADQPAARHRVQGQLRRARRTSMEHVTVTDPGRTATRSTATTCSTAADSVSYGQRRDPPQRYGYDAAGFLTTVDELGRQPGVHVTNDVHGNVLTRTWYPVEPATAAGHRARGRPGAVRRLDDVQPGLPVAAARPAPRSTPTYSYDAANPLDPRNDELTAVADAPVGVGHDTTYQTTYAYNTAGQLTAATTPATSDFPAGRTTSYAYSTGTETAAYGGGTDPGRAADVGDHARRRGRPATPTTPTATWRRSPSRRGGPPSTPTTGSAGR